MGKVLTVLCGPIFWVLVLILITVWKRIRRWVKPRSRDDKRVPLMHMWFGLVVVALIIYLGRIVSDWRWVGFLCWGITLFTAVKALKEKRRTDDEVTEASWYCLIALAMSWIGILITVLQSKEVKWLLGAALVQVVFLVAARIRRQVGWLSRSYLLWLNVATVSATVTLVAVGIATVQYYLR